ncbi:hypothetical protein EMIT0111MI5_180117 [Burkholderia sp. IT-111MI5]
MSDAYGRQRFGRGNEDGLRVAVPHTLVSAVRR